MKKPTLLLQSPIFINSGYGRHSMDIAKMLLRSGKFDLKILPMRWGGCGQRNLEEEAKTDPEIDALAKRVVQLPLQVQPEVFMQISIPNEFNRVGSVCNIGITAGIETTACRGEWMEGLNRMDMTIVTSEFSKKVFETCAFNRQDPRTQQQMQLKLMRPLEVLFEGIDTKIYTPLNVTTSNTLTKTFNGIKEDFCYLFVGHWLQGDLGHDRKNVGMLVKTFLETFKNKKDAPALILKTNMVATSTVDRFEILKRIKAIESTVQGSLPSVYLLHGDLLDSEMNAMYNHPKIKAMVSFTRGEGYCRPFAEFSSTGKPLLVSDWSGHLDFCDKQHTLLIPGILEKVHQSACNDWIVPQSQWFTVNYTVAAKMMEDLHTNYGKYLERAHGQKENIEKNFTFAEMEKKFNSILDKYIPFIPTEEELILPALKLPKLENPEQFNLPKLKIL